MFYSQLVPVGGSFLTRELRTGWGVVDCSLIREATFVLFPLFLTRSLMATFRVAEVRGFKSLITLLHLLHPRHLEGGFRV